ncbi:MAG: type II toxin-antitoxin system RelE/ParE family toxin [Nanoarchaeota archaeon]|nr:type II toxin-antitoxin system RelE/ParE family toxin [Nanoarchaeota archaeon]MBU0963295.1 type II toxin-antitoxin system RelE/ParE family toxin [Nanoarchaeota archaeon]
MVIKVIEKTDEFVRIIKKLKDNVLKEQIEKQIIKIIKDPEIGKPMMFLRKRTREVYISKFRLSYAYIKEEDKLILLDFYHKDKQ